MNMDVDSIAGILKSVPEVISVDVLSEHIVNGYTSKIEFSIHPQGIGLLVAGVYYDEKMVKQFAVENIHQLIDSILFEHNKYC